MLWVFTSTTRTGLHSILFTILVAKTSLNLWGYWELHIELRLSHGAQVIRPRWPGMYLICFPCSNIFKRYLIIWYLVVFSTKDGSLFLQVQEADIFYQSFLINFSVSKRFPIAKACFLVVFVILALIYDLKILVLYHYTWMACKIFTTGIR